MARHVWCRAGPTPTGGETMRRLAITIGLTLSLAVPAVAQSYRQRLDRLFNNPIPSAPTLGDIMQRRRQREQNLLNYQPAPRPRYLDPRDYTQQYRPEWDANPTEGDSTSSEISTLERGATNTTGRVSTSFGRSGGRPDEGTQTINRTLEAPVSSAGASLLEGGRLCQKKISPVELTLEEVSAFFLLMLSVGLRSTGKHTDSHRDLALDVTDAI